MTDEELAAIKERRDRGDMNNLLILSTREAPLAILWQRSTCRETGRSSPTPARMCPRSSPRSPPCVLPSLMCWTPTPTS